MEFKIEKLILENKQFEGILKYENRIFILQILGCDKLENIEIAPWGNTEFDTIYGKLNSNEYIKLEYCIVQNTSFDMKEKIHKYMLTVSHFYISNLQLEGIDLLNEKWDMFVSLGNIEKWFGVKEPEYIMQNNFKYKIDDNMFLEYVYEDELCIKLHNMQFATNKDYEKIYYNSISIKSLFSLLIGEELSIERIVVKDCEKKYIQLYHSILDCFSSKVIMTNSNRQINLVQYFANGSIETFKLSENIFKKWFRDNFYQRLEIIYLIESLNKRSFNEYLFLNMISCIEAINRRRGKELMLIEALKASANNIIDCFNIFKQQKKLNDIEHIQGIDLFKDIKKTRNFFTHLNPNEMYKMKIKGIKMIYVTKFLQWIIRLNILKELGIEDTVLRSYVGDTEFKMILDRLFYNNSLIKQEVESQLDDYINKLKSK